MNSPAPFIDTHVHFWDHGVDGLRWRWLEPGFSHRQLTGMHTLDAPRYTSEEFRAESTGSGVSGLVHVQAVDGAADLATETAWLQRMAEDTGEPNAIVASCAVHEADAVDLIARHAQHDRCVGVRDITASRLLDADRASAALADLASRGWSFEARRHHQQFGELTEIADRWPDLVIVMSHGCLPAQRTGADRTEWTDAARVLARRPNVVCKISAVAGASDPHWTVDSIRPWILGCIDTFGPDRCMLGTNWPVDRMFGTYPELVAAYRKVLDELDGNESLAVLSGTARRVYRIEG